MPVLWRGNFPPSVILSTSIYSVGGRIGDMGAAPANSTWGVANSTQYLPFVIPWPVVVKRGFWVNGGTGDTCDLGIMEADGTKIISSGATAQSGANQPQFVTFNQDLKPGFYYVAFADNNAATGTFLQCSVSLVQNLRSAGVLYQASSATVPSPATFAALATHVRFPVVGLEITRAI